MSPLPRWRPQFLIHWQCRRVKIGLSATSFAILTSLVAATVSEADKRHPSGLDAPASDGAVETPRREATLTGDARVADVRAPIEAASSESAPGQLVNAGAIAGRVVSCAGPIPGTRVSIGGRADSATSGPGGAFELNDLPPGTFDLTFEAQEQQGTIAGIHVVSGQTTDIGEINLTDVRADPNHCGRCGTRCPPGASCAYGGCACPAGLTLCGDTCTGLADLEHCRACQNRCVAWPNTIPRCGAQDCVFQCFAGTADCDGRRINGCETQIDRDGRNCGACGNVCAPGLRCVDSRCQ